MEDISSRMVPCLELTFAVCWGKRPGSEAYLVEFLVAQDSMYDLEKEQCHIGSDIRCVRVDEERFEVVVVVWSGTWRGTTRRERSSLRSSSAALDLMSFRRKGSFFGTRSRFSRSRKNLMEFLRCWIISGRRRCPGIAFRKCRRAFFLNRNSRVPTLTRWHVPLERNQ